MSFLSRFRRGWRFSLVLLCSTWAVVVPASSLLYEPFNYPDGSLVAVSGGAWTTHSGIAGQLEVVSGRLDMRVPETEDVNVLVPGQPYAANSSTILYVSFIVNASALPAAGGQYFAHFKNASTGFRAKVFTLMSGDGPGQFRIGIANSVNNPTATNLTDLNLNTDYRVYLRYVISNASTTLWVDPTSEASPSVVATDGGAAQIIAAFALRQDSGLGVIALDDLRIGTSFADVYAPPILVPPTITQQPASTSAIEGGAATFMVTASGSVPLSYQWRFNNNPISGATNHTLTLTGLTTNAAGWYSVIVTNTAGVTNSAIATLTVLQPNASGTLTLVHYNVKGLFASDWSTNAAQVQAIARQLQYLNPDVITLNEIRNGLQYEMTNWMIAFFPTHTLAVSPGTDNSLRSGFISRYPITRSQSWLDGIGLTNFGFAGEFTRDLFEAEITVPGATEPLHIFTTHLKSAEDVDSQQRRAAECSAISNFFATVFLPTNGGRPYLLTGDLNEDINLPMSQNLAAIQRLVSPPTGLQLTTPLNPFTLTRFTHSIQGSLDARFDYVLPGGLLFSNLVNSQVFRTDLLPPPLPLNLNSNDNIVASDHLPVVMVFNYPDPPLRATLGVSNQMVTLTWPALVGRKFAVESSSDLTTWMLAASNLVAFTAQPTWTTATTNAERFYRILRAP
jgi:endonuclease/exonuclease/phosphatase family metal-dependent hydrolase